MWYKNQWYAFEGKANGYPFIKDYPWEFEKEFRIVLTTKKPVGKVAVKIPEEVKSSLKIKLAPEFQEKDIWKKLGKLDGFEKSMDNRISHSNLKINMNLYDRNKESILAFIERISREKTEVEYLERLRNALGSGRVASIIE